MTVTPDRITAIQQIIDEVIELFPLYNKDTFTCGTENTSLGCPKKLMEMVDSELNY